MANTVTANLKLKLPQLGKKPWKSDWDFNFTLLDQLIGGLTVDGSVHAKIADSIPGSALAPFIQVITGDLTSIPTIPAGETKEIRVDHTADKIFEVPCDPIFTTPSVDINTLVLGDRSGLTSSEYGGVFVVRVENHSESDISGSDITWMRKGFKIS